MLFEHKVKSWEKAIGRIQISSSVKLPTTIYSDEFIVRIDEKTYLARKIDARNRIWIGTQALAKFQVGDILQIELLEGVLMIKKRQ